MEFVPGGSLARLVKTMDCALGEEQARAYIRQVLRGLEYLHEHGIIHRDIKGDNVLVDTAGGMCKISDFGSSKKTHATFGGSTSSGGVGGPARGAAQTIAGTPNWMAPEVITCQGVLGDHAAKADVWSVGCTSIELLNRGQPPWPTFSSQWAAIYHIGNATGPPEGIPDFLSEACLDFVLGCLTRDPVARQSVAMCLQHRWIIGPAMLSPLTEQTPPMLPVADVDPGIGKLLRATEQRMESSRMASFTEQSEQSASGSASKMRLVDASIEQPGPPQGTSAEGAGSGEAADAAVPERDKSASSGTFGILPPFGAPHGGTPGDRLAIRRSVSQLTNQSAAALSLSNVPVGAARVTVHIRSPFPTSGPLPT